MFPTWRMAYVRAAIQQGPWRTVARGLASWIATVGGPAVVLGLALTVVSGSTAGELIGLWVVLVVGVLLVAGGLWAWQVSGLVDKETRARYLVLREVESARLLLRPPVPRDAVALAATIDAEMLAANGWTERQARAMVKAVRAGHPTPGLLVFEARSDGALVGGGGVHPRVDDPSSQTLGWWIGPRHRRAGYAGEAVAALVAAIHDAGFATVEIGTAETNLAVQRICDRIGATETGRREQALPNGSVVPGIWYEHRQVSADQP
ncbi:GNAT family N-acetyltransferase [Nocardia farcinica]|uniref:GNAT family N-acetyltransferase n=1 Tax=Nocardia farcinica TaxID=37329 RepID=UPI0024551F78|nr:GNAT family N-acetyltransferase [Nocardia farcinica]